MDFDERFFYQFELDDPYGFSEEWRGIEFGKPGTYSGQKQIRITRSDSWQSACIEIRQMPGRKEWALWQRSTTGSKNWATGELKAGYAGRWISKPNTLRHIKTLAQTIIVGRSELELYSKLDEVCGTRGTR